MKGEKVERRFGWDCHGLPAEMEAEKELGVSGRIAIAEFGIDKFNDQCRTSVMRYTNEWKDYVTKQARWVDFDGGYRTMDTDYMESVIWSFSELYKKGLVYEDMRVMPYSWKCETPLSNFETKLDNSYREKESKSVFIKFELEVVPDFVKKQYPQIDKVFITAWTTTPWTLPSNLALAVGSDIDYVVLQKDNIGYICAKDLQDKIIALL
jgi:isoleucyl-tRNA synthetase